MKELLNFLLAKTPRLYEQVLRLKGHHSLDKVIFLNLVKSQDIVVDIGANRGYYTLLFSHLVGHHGEVHAFEPVPPTFAYLSQTIGKQQRYQNVYLNQTAVGDSNEQINIYMPGNDDCQASMTPHNFGFWQYTDQVNSYTCSVIKLDDYAESKLKQKLDFFKCDVEGAELLALKGALATLTKYLPIIYLEVSYGWSEKFDYTPQDLVRLLITIGYTDFYFVRDGVCLLEDPLEQLTPELFPDSANVANLLCTVSEKHKYKVRSLVKRS